MLACLEECLEWCHLLLGSCDYVYIVTSMSCRRRGKREGAGTGVWCEKMLWLVNIKKSLPCIVCLYSWDLDDFLWTSLSLCLSHKTFCIDCRPSSDLLLFYYSHLITFLSKRDYSSFWGIFRLCCRCIIFLRWCLRCNIGHWNAGSTLTCIQSVTAFKRSVVFMRAHKANIDCDIFSVYKLWFSCSWFRNVKTFRSGSLPMVSFTGGTNITQSFCNVIPQTKAVQYAEPL